MLGAMKSTFDDLDKDKNGSLDQKEFSTAMRDVFKFDWSAEKMDEMLKKIDTDKSGTIEKKEFTRVFYAAALANPEQDIQELISSTLTTMAQKGGMGMQLKAGMPQLKKVANPGQAKLAIDEDVQSKISQKFQEIDVDRDGALNIAEFSAALKDLGMKWQVATIRKVMGQLGENG